MGIIQFVLFSAFIIWPFSSGKDYHMTADNSVPAASGKVHAQWDKQNGNTKLDVKVEHLARPSSLNPPATTYILWVQPKGGDAVKEGSIGVDNDLKGELHVVTVSKDFDVFITPEQSSTVTMPSRMEVLRTHVDIS
jgi:phage major head subunit gpT-like protein